MAAPTYDARKLAIASSMQNLALSASTALTVPAGATEAFIVADGTADVRWTDDGTTPTASVGHLLKAGVAMTYSNDLSTLRFIRAAAGGSISVSYYKVP
jgi:hypothetical protein